MVLCLDRFEIYVYIFFLRIMRDSNRFDIFYLAKFSTNYVFVVFKAKTVHDSTVKN